jgi:hypothetical protein
MKANDQKFSTATLRCTQTALQLHFPGDPADGGQHGSSAVLGTLALECSEPSCKSGTDPIVAGRVFQLDMEIRMTPGSTDQAPLLATAASMAGTWAPVPVLDASYAVVCGQEPCDHDHSQPDLCAGLCQKLQAHRAAAQLPPGTRFYVYKVTETPEQLQSLRGKLIAIPVVPGLPGNPP